MGYKKLDRNLIRFKSLSERKNRISIVRDAVFSGRNIAALTPGDHRIIEQAASRILKAREKGRAVIMAFGAHTVKNGLAPVLNAMIEKGWVTHLATNGAGIIHDWEFSYLGESSEDVRENVAAGQFGIWQETGFYINLALVVGAYEGLGYGESVGKMIYNEGVAIPGPEFLRELAVKNLRENYELSSAAVELAGFIDKYGLRPGFMSIPHPFKKYSVQAFAYQHGIPFTGHPMFGHDIIYCHPANSGSAVGRTAERDFLTYAGSISDLNGGVYLSVGSSVMSPMIFEKSLSMSRNISIQHGDNISDIYMLVVDLAKIEWDWVKDGEPAPDNPAYYLRFCKTFSRMGGEMEYLSADNRDFFLALYNELNK